MTKTGATATVGVSLSAVAIVAIILTQSGVFNAKLSEDEKTEMRIDMRTFLTDDKRIGLTRTPIDEMLIQGAMQLEIQAWEQGKVFEFGLAVRDTFEWYGLYPGRTQRDGYHGSIVTYGTPRIVSFRLWTDDDVILIPLPRVVPITALMDSTGYLPRELLR